jgi:hypothetical protein
MEFGWKPASRWALVATLALSCAGIASASKGSERALLRGEIPAGFVVGAGTPPLTLQVTVESGAVQAVEAGVEGGNVTAKSDVGQGQTMLTIKHGLDVNLKFDLYISPDGETFVYTSTCAVSPGISGMEMWDHPIHAFALGNARVVAKDRMSCD